MNDKMPTIALMMDHFLTLYQTTLRDAVEFEARSRNVNLLCIIGRALDSPHVHERVQNAIFNDVSPHEVDGIILVGTTLSSYSGKERIEAFCRGFSLPMCNIGLQLAAIPSVVLNNHKFRSVVEHLVNVHHCTRIAYIGGPPANEEAVIRRKAFIEGLELCGVPFHPELEKTGKFTLQSGYECATELLESNAEFDALVTANDNMALGAVGVLKARGIRIPEDVRVTGFDDTLAARFHSPPLTTLRQPVETIGRLAFDLILRQINGETVPLITEVDPVFYCRQSCGCDAGEEYQYEKQKTQSELPLSVALQTARRQLKQQLEASIQIPKGLFGNWIDRVLTALEKEFSGKSGQLLILFEEILNSGGWRRWLLDELQSVVSLLKSYFPISRGVESADPEMLWHGAQVFLCNASAKEQIRQQVDADLASTLFLNRSALALTETLTHDGLIKEIVQDLESIGIQNAAVMVFQKDSRDTMDILVAIKNGVSRDTKGQSCLSTELLPSILGSETPESYVIAPLSAGSDLLGRMVLELGAPDLYYEMLREHLSMNLKNIASHQFEMEKLQATADADRQELELQHRQKLESLGLLTGGVAHDFNNVLSVIMGNLDVALLELEDTAPIHDVILECKAVAKHSAKLCSQLMTYAGCGDRVFKRINLNQTILELEDLLMLSVQKRAKLIFDLEEGIFDIEGDTAKINQLLVSLIINASEVMETERETIKIRTRLALLKENDAATTSSPRNNNVILEIVAASVPESRLFELRDPETTGQASVITIVEAHDGTFAVRQGQHQHAHIEIKFPALPKISDVPVNHINFEPVQMTGHGTLLLVDNEPGVLRMGERLLKRLGFDVLLAKSKEQALQLCRAAKAPIVCVIMDISAANGDGSTIAETIRRHIPHLPFVFTSACDQSEQNAEAENAAYLRKPYDLAQLGAVLKTVLNQN